MAETTKQDVKTEIMDQTALTVGTQLKTQYKAIKALLKISQPPIEIIDAKGISDDEFKSMASNAITNRNLHLKLANGTEQEITLDELDGRVGEVKKNFADKISDLGVDLNQFNLSNDIPKEETLTKVADATFAAAEEKKGVGGISIFINAIISWVVSLFSGEQSDWKETLANAAAPEVTQNVKEKLEVLKKQDPDVARFLDNGKTTTTQTPEKSAPAPEKPAAEKPPVENVTVPAVVTATPQDRVLSAVAQQARKAMGGSVTESPKDTVGNTIGVARVGDLSFDSKIIDDGLKKEILSIKGRDPKNPSPNDFQNYIAQVTSNNLMTARNESVSKYTSTPASSKLQVEYFESYLTARTTDEFAGADTTIFAKNVANAIATATVEATKDPRMADPKFSQKDAANLIADKVGKIMDSNKDSYNIAHKLSPKLANLLDLKKDEETGIKNYHRDSQYAIPLNYKIDDKGTTVKDMVLKEVRNSIDAETYQKLKYVAGLNAVVKEAGTTKLAVQDLGATGTGYGGTGGYNPSAVKAGGQEVASNGR